MFTFQRAFGPRIFAAVFTALLLTLFVSPGAAQSSLFNTPTSDVLGRGELYVEADLDAHVAPYQRGGWQSYGFQTVYGVSRRTEIGLNGYLVRSSDGLAPVELQPNFKYQIYNNEAKGISV